MENISS